MTEMESLSSSSYDTPESRKDMNDTMIYGQVPAKQRSCDAVNTPASCVNKAVNHIQDLEVKMEESFQQYGHLYMFEKSLKRSSDLKSEKVEDSLFSELKAERLLYRKDIQPLKWKTVNVLQEAMELVARLEDERRAAQEALEAEIRRKRKLYQYADALSVWRQRELPIAVQKEWEKSSEEFTEFQCLLKSRNMKLQHAVNQLTRISIANADIQENIDFMKKYSPLLGEKMSYEGDAMEDVKAIYKRTKTAYDFVHYQLERTKAAYEEILGEQESKRIFYANTLSSAEILFNCLTNELLEAEKISTDICNKVREKKEAILRNKELLQKLIKKDSQLKSDIISWQEKLNRLSEKLINQEKEIEELQNEYTESVEEIRTRKASHHSDIKELEDKLNEYLQKISDTEKENKYLQDENKGFLQKFRESSRKKVAYQAEIRVLQKNVRRMEQHLKKVNKDLYSAELAYGEIRAKLEDLEQELLKEKEKFKNLEENVRKQIKDEVSAWKLTQKRVKALNAELDQRKKEFDKLEAKILKKLKKLDHQIAEQQEMLQKNKELLKECRKKIALLNQKFQELNEKEAKILKELSDQKKNLENLLGDVKVKFKDISKLLNDLNEKIEKWQKEIIKLTEQSEDKQLLLNLTEKALAALREKYARIRIKEDNAQALVDFLYERLDYVEKKLKEDSKVFEELLWTRQNHLKQKKAAFILDLEENLRLAQEYQMLQVRFLDDKNQLLDILDYKIRAEEALRDQKELSQLQSKMHRLLLEYFKLRGLHSQAALAKFQQSSHEDVRKILAVQGGLTETVQQTSIFLKSLTDGSST